MSKKEILYELKTKSGKPISECLNALNSTNSIEKAFEILFANEIQAVKSRINVKDEKLIAKALTIAKSNIEAAISILTHGYDVFSKDRIKYPEFISDRQETKKYDDASWHYDGKYPKNLPSENGATHIGMFLTWCIENKLISEELAKEAKSEIEQVIKREITGAEFLIKVCDEKLIDEDLNKIGNEFALDYYDDDTEFGKKYNSFADDYSETFDEKAAQNGFEYESFYHVENTFENYELVKQRIDKRFEEWKIFRNKIE